MGRGRPGDGSGHQGLSRPARHPAGAQRASRAGASARGVRRTVAARAVAGRRGRRLVGRRARRVGVDGDDGGAGDARAPTNAPCSCCARCSASATTRSPRRSASPARRCASSRTAPANTCRPGASGSSPSTRKRSLELTAQFFAAAATGDIDGLIVDARARRGVDRRQRRTRSVPHADRSSGRTRWPGSSSAYSASPARTGASSLPSTTVRPRWCSTSATASRASSRSRSPTGRSRHFYAMRNPEKLGGVKVAREISR